MTTIDKLDLNVHNLYAIRTKMIEQINQQYHLEHAASIPPQTAMVDIYPKLTELDILLGIVPIHTPWAYFFPPKNTRALRRSSFSKYRIVPSMGSVESQDELLNAIEQMECSTPEEAAEKAAITSCFSQIQQINSWMSFIIGRIGQFLQG